MPPRAFSLVELLVVTAVLAVLSAILLPGLGAARDRARSAVCKSNLRQLHLANENYALANHDYYVPAASDIWASGGGLHRWHGVRRSAHPVRPEDGVFDPRRGPLAASLADGKVKACPSFRDYRTDAGGAAFEAGTGGYGYNARGVGSRDYLFGFSGKSALLGMRAHRIKGSSVTVMFTDAAMPKGYPQPMIIEYSFAEAPHFVLPGPDGPYESPALADPSIHFRHARRANVVWCDGHASDEVMSFTKPSNIYQGDNNRWQVGWFGPQDNGLFSPE